MRGTVYFLEMSDQLYRSVNEHGWNHDVKSRAYLQAKAGKISAAMSLELYQPAAEVETLPNPNADEVWMALQNISQPWPQSGHPAIKNRRTDRPRSMDVGDYIQWEDGSIEVCQPIGWNIIK